MITNEKMCPSAVVVGVCAHGLAIVRSLARHGVDVHIVEANAALPGLRSRYGMKHLVEDINGPGLVGALLHLRDIFKSSCNPVLFLTNDRMIRVVAERAGEVAAAYRLSWEASAKQVADLNSKDLIERRCKEVGLNYPRTVVLERPADVLALGATIRWPQIIKPSRPLSSFKVKVADSWADAAAFLRSRGADFPVLLQEWIPGDDTRIYFSALYLDRGSPLVRFDGRKLRSFPMGHTTVAEPYKNDAVFECARRFFRGSDVSGPASLEMKEDDNGRLWVIEPTVGRTDFWLDLCIANGVNLPVVEYDHQVGEAVSPTHVSNDFVWINAERDLIALPWYVFHLSSASRFIRRLRFTYFDAHDPQPFFLAMTRRAGDVGRAVGRRIHIRAVSK